MTYTSLRFNVTALGAMQDLASGIGSLLSRGDALLLRGDLGSGKTTFTKLLVLSLSEKQEVSSPTFGLVNIYEGKDEVDIWHYDLYRIKSASEIYELGIEESLKNGITIIEWPDLLTEIVPKDSMTVHLCQYNNQREAVVSGKHLGELSRIMDFKYG